METRKTNSDDRLTELHRLRFQERSLNRRWETACDRFAHFPNGAIEQQVAELARELDEIRHEIRRLSANSSDPRLG